MSTISSFLQFFHVSGANVVVRRRSIEVVHKVRVTRMRRSALLCESCNERRNSVTFQVTPMMCKNGIPSKGHRQGPCRLSGGIERQDIGFA